MNSIEKKIPCLVPVCNFVQRQIYYHFSKQHKYAGNLSLYHPLSIVGSSFFILHSQRKLCGKSTSQETAYLQNYRHQATFFSLLLENTFLNNCSAKVFIYYCVTKYFLVLILLLQDALKVVTTQ